MGDVEPKPSGAPTLPATRRYVAAGAGALLGLVALVASLDRWVPFDAAVWRAVLFARGCGTDRVVEHAVGVATSTLGVLLVLVVGMHVRRAGVQSVWPWLASWALGLLVSKTMKHAFTRDRPSALPDLTVGYSFPSAHVMNGVLAMVAIVVLARVLPRRGLWRAVAVTAAGVLIGGRVLLGRHWATDVVGGVLTAVVLTGLVTPATARRPVLVPVVLAVVASGVLAFDARLGEGGMRLPSPLVARAAALVDVDVGPEMSSPRSGDWREAGLERPFGSYLWLEGRASIVLNVPVRAGSDGTKMQLAFGGRPEKLRGSCMDLEVTLNDRRLARFVSFVGWREYRLAIPPGVLRAGDNVLTIDARRVDRSGRFGVTYARIATEPSAAE